MSDRIWLRVMFRNAVVHVVGKGLWRELAADLQRRGHPLDLEAPKLVGKANPDRIREWGIDLPGMVNIRRPIEEFRFLGLDFSVPSEDVTEFVRRLDELPERRFADGASYYKLHGYAQAIVLTPAQRRELLRLLRERVPTAERRATEFWAGRDTLQETLAKAQGLTPEQFEEEGLAGPDKVARFAKPKSRGEA